VDVISPEVQNRIDSLKRELDLSIPYALGRARFNHWSAIAMMWCAIACSSAAGLGGIFFGLDARTTGGLALVPSVIAFAASALKLQSNANWHYRKQYALMKLRRRLTYELSEVPSVSEVQGISREWSELTEAMHTEWERNLALSWAGFEFHARPAPRDQDLRSPSKRKNTSA
jgi:hypothetical protein